MTNFEALYLTLFIVGFWVIFGWLSLKIRKFLGEKLSRNSAFTSLIASFYFWLDIKKGPY